MAGKRFTVRSRSIRWREGRYKGRGRSRPRPPPRPRPVLDLVIAVIVSLVAAFFILCMAFSLYAAYGIPLHLGYGGLLAAVVLGCLVFGPRDRGGLMIAGGLGLLCVIGSIGLYGVRGQIRSEPPERPPSVIALEVE